MYISPFLFCKYKKNPMKYRLRFYNIQFILSPINGFF